MKAELEFVYSVVIIMSILEVFINLIVIIPSSNKCYDTLKNVFNIFKYIPKKNLDEVIKNYDDQLKEIYDIYTCENIQLVTGDSNEKKKKKNSTKEIKYKFIIFSIGIGVLFIMPFLSIMTINTKIKADTNDDMESWSFFKEYLGKPGCVRPERLKFQCEKREYDSGSIEIHHVPLNNKENIYKIFQKSINHPFMQFHNKVIHDIAGHTLQYNEIGKKYLVKKTNDFLIYTLLLHAFGSFIIVLLFIIYITRKIKHQLHIMEALTNVIFSIPLTVYDSNNRLKNFIETGKF
ncbi:hypothetical protein LY90DRAFT_511649 [Neocallimastix californiae]|uniref:Uncharacterized protein n=1 Tax=Neocallimastix californiae TaxID=1754190 RepID=A0A1Y2BMW8_9FUNG|nr:hypothetical protein LY90DRAFT_511649 [Neocallimastix californiae]|eukprot:ORY36083.1 hypothetical protein LY90DRAFT_511649 [Neocallimastix californiae]